MIELCKSHFEQMDDKLLAGGGTDVRRFDGSRWVPVDESEAHRFRLVRYYRHGTMVLDRPDEDGRPMPALIHCTRLEYFRNGRLQRSDGGQEIERGSGFGTWVLNGSCLTYFGDQGERDSAVVLAQSEQYLLVRYISRFDGSVRYRAGCRDFTLKEAMIHWRGSPRKSFINALKREFFNFSLEQIK